MLKGRVGGLLPKPSLITKYGIICFKYSPKEILYAAQNDGQFIDIVFPVCLPVYSSLTFIRFFDIDFVSFLYDV